MRAYFSLLHKDFEVCKKRDPLDLYSIEVYIGMSQRVLDNIWFTIIIKSTKEFPSVPFC